jgi:hypothetical protein
MELSGTLGRGLDYDFWTSNTGLNRAQTLSLITIGRTTNELRARARGDVSDADSTDMPTGGTGTRDSGFASASDKLVKDVTADVMNVFLEDPLKALTLGVFDTVQVGVGTESVQAKLGKKVGRLVKIDLEYEQGYRGWSNARISFDAKVLDDIFLTLRYLSVRPESETEEPESSWRIQATFKFIIP